MRKVFYLIFILVWMGVIFCFSNQEADLSTRMSDGFIERTIGSVYKLFDSNVTIEKLNYIKSKYSYSVRKMAHFTIYLILGLFVFNFIKEYSIRNIILLSVVICFLYACSDEIHQSFVIGRSCEFKDVLIDTTGSFIGIMLFNIIYSLRKK